MSPPKIEELPPNDDEVAESSEPQERLPSAKTAKRNPFASKRKTTVRRTADEVYPERKGLNKPDFLGDKPIDLLFQKLESLLAEPYEDLTIGLLNTRIPPGPGPDTTTVDNTRYHVIEYLMNSLIDVQKASLESKMPNKALITISLHDVKTFSKLVNAIIILGVYPALNVFHIGIPFEKRNLSKNMSKQVKIDTIKSGPAEAFQLLTLIYDKFYQLFQTPSDVTGLLSKGTGFSDFLTVAIAIYSIPGFQHKTDASFEQVEKIPDTYELFQTYSLLLTTPSPQFFKQFVMSRLQKLPYDAPRKDGLRSLIEYILGLREQEEIDIAKFDHVANVVLSKPKDVTTTTYFNSIGKQAYALLVNINRPLMASCVTYIMEKLWHKNKLVVKDFFLQRIWDQFVTSHPKEEEKKEQTVVALNSSVLVGEAAFNNAINVLISISKKGLEADVYQAVMEPIIVSLWGYYLFLKQHGKSVQIVTDIMTSYFTVMKDFDDNNLAGIDLVAKNLVFNGGDSWTYEIGPNNLTQLVKKKAEFTSESKETKILKFIEGLDFACSNFMILLENVDDEVVYALFTLILKQWLESANLLGGEEKNPFIKLVDLKLLESIGDKFKESLARTPHEMLAIVHSFLKKQQQDSGGDDDGDAMDDDVDSDDEDEGDGQGTENFLPVLLELLSAILSENDIVIDDSCTEQLTGIKQSLEKLQNNKNNKPLNSNMRNSIESLEQRISNILSGEIPVSNELDAQRLVLNRAITSLNDPLVPIRAHGLYLLRQLIESRSEIISVDFVINLHLVQLKDPEPYIYLNVIKGLESLIDWEELPVLKIMCQLYTSTETDLDERLRIGEVILRYIQVSNEKFTGESANLVVETTLTVIRSHSSDDDRVRMSAMSLLGVCCKVNPIGLIGRLEDALDCVVGILDLEKGPDKAIMRRSAVMLIQDLILGTSESDKVAFPEPYREKIVIRLRYVAETDNDIFVREQARKVLDLIQELARLGMELYFEKMNI
ncbi:uncharacterized protein LODBEIA_P59610 [Lodderomyces beijingensis]|uniref:RNA polymerase II assembly factor Rtp1 C-terminal domain-containing protein n=1 Tax=Lodderomyces beijingensis TaxID=1775926 RepID=A0ABP0ZVS3_9ASCO